MTTEVCAYRVFRMYLNKKTTEVLQFAIYQQADTRKRTYSILSKIDGENIVIS